MQERRCHVCKFLRGLGLIPFLFFFGSEVWADWYITTVDTTPYSGVDGTSIALDSLGRPHIAYARYAGPGGLMYASWNPDSTWTIESVFDSAGARTKISGIEPSLALDSKGYPHVSFWWGDLGYAWKDSAGWHTSHPGPGWWIEGTSLKLDSNDYPHIGYVATYSGIILYTYLDEESWHTEEVDTGSTGSGAGSVSIALGDNSDIHFAYDACPAGLKYAKRNNGEWHIEQVDAFTHTEFGSVAYPSLTVDSLDRICIAYFLYCAEEDFWLKYAVKKDTGWYIETLDKARAWERIDRVALSLDKYNNPHISYRGHGWLKHAWRDNNHRAWYIEKIDSIGTYYVHGGYTSVAIDNNDYAHISYNEELISLTQGTLRYATGYALTTGIGEAEKEKQSSIVLEVYPTLVHQQTRIDYTLGKPCAVNISIYNIMGQRIATLVNEKQTAGKYTSYWGLKNDKSKSVVNGIYFCCLRTKAHLLIEKIVVIR
jgi:hypothetical protein